MTHRIIVTNCDLSFSMRTRLIGGVGPDYLLKKEQRLRDVDLVRVEIMLVDIVGAGGRELLARARDMPKLRLIQSLRAGADSVDFSSMPQGVVFCANIGAYSLPMGEFTIGMILCLAKYFGNRNEKLRNGMADNRNSILLRGKTIGIIGAGGIGKEVSRLARCFGIRTFGVNTTGRPSKYVDRMFSPSQIDLVLKSADVVVLALPLSLDTFHIINRKRLNMMKKDCILVNVGRGYLIDEKALYDHMVKNPEFKCGLDVWWEYPKLGEKFLQRFPFFDLSNFLGTPHVSGYVPEEREIATRFAVDNVLRFVKGRKLKGTVNKEFYVGLSDLIKKAKTS